MDFFRRRSCSRFPICDYGLVSWSHACLVAWWFCGIAFSQAFRLGQALSVCFMRRNQERFGAMRNSDRLANSSASTVVYPHLHRASAAADCGCRLIYVSCPRASPSIYALGCVLCGGLVGLRGSGVSAQRDADTIFFVGRTGILVLLGCEAIAWFRYGVQAIATDVRFFGLFHFVWGMRRFVGYLNSRIPKPDTP